MVQAMADDQAIRAFLKDVNHRGWNRQVLVAVATNVVHLDGGWSSSEQDPEALVRSEGQEPFKVKDWQARFGQLNANNVREAMVEMVDWLRQEPQNQDQTVEEYVLGYQPVAGGVSAPERDELAEWNGFSRRAVVMAQECRVGWTLGTAQADEVGTLVEDVAAFVAARRELGAMLKEERRLSGIIPTARMERAKEADAREQDAAEVSV
jgi:hypothetical protein